LAFEKNNNNNNVPGMKIFHTQHWSLPKTWECLLQSSGYISCQQMHVCIPWRNHDRFYDSRRAKFQKLPNA